MEELEFWIDTCEKIGIPTDIFQEIKEKTSETYRKIQKKLAKAQNSLLSKDLDNDNDIFRFERYFGQLVTAFNKQESVIMLFALEIFVKALHVKIYEKLKRNKIKAILSACIKVVKRLETQYSMQMTDVISIAISKIEQCKYKFAERL
ncbi:hypothetical protein SteCoe_11862 [Stentor coeruleus]|uniref:Uncharacterized protein n=1 Tax=Stentor coeruleus TaxID=5963 RepID=A0A1R2CC43_9CILI|nr:hypothetical protein SteCoe_11862 [Stentor coeruleus]